MSDVPEDKSELFWPCGHEREDVRFQREVEKIILLDAPHMQDAIANKIMASARRLRIPTKGKTATDFVKLEYNEWDMDINWDAIPVHDCSFDGSTCRYCQIKPSNKCPSCGGSARLIFVADGRHWFECNDDNCANDDISEPCPVVAKWIARLVKAYGPKCISDSPMNYCSPRQRQRFRPLPKQLEQDP